MKEEKEKVNKEETLQQCVVDIQILAKAVENILQLLTAVVDTQLKDKKQKEKNEKFYK